MVARARQTKKSNLQPKILPGYVRAETIKCGKANCRCMRGELHGPYFYHFTWSDGRRSKFYVKRADVESVRAACEAYRSLQRTLLAGRRRYALILARARELARSGELLEP